MCDAIPALLRLDDFEDDISWVSNECRDECCVSPQHLFDVRRGTIPDSQPDDLWRDTAERAQGIEVIIFGHDRVPIGARKRPDVDVISVIKPMKHDMAARWILIC